MTLLRSLATGTAAGAVGTAALNVATYADMAVRGRAESEMPGKLVKNVASSAGLSGLTRDDETSQHRRSALGALLGYGNGLGVGMLYAMIRPLLPRRISVPLAALVVGAAAMALSDVPATKTGATDPAKWSPGDWLADAIPHGIYGAAVVLAVEGLRSGEEAA